jgi:hypothetical protein
MEINKNYIAQGAREHSAKRGKSHTKVFKTGQNFPIASCSLTCSCAGCPRVLKGALSGSGGENLRKWLNKNENGLAKNRSAFSAI